MIRFFLLESNLTLSCVDEGEYELSDEVSDELPIAVSDSFSDDADDATPESLDVVFPLLLALLFLLAFTKLASLPVFLRPFKAMWTQTKVIWLIAFK